MTDFVTVLTTVGPMLTKRFMADGRVDAYDNALSFHSREEPVANIHELSALLSKLHGKRKCCVIRGQLTEKPEMADVEGTYRRTNLSFRDVPHHWLMIDIDKFRPGFSDPVTEVEYAIDEFLECAGLEMFKGCSYHWQLSSSAGTEKAEGILKCHVWFWSEEAHLSTTFFRWAKALPSKMVDSAVFRQVQVHYTADPIFDDGVPDPVAVRYGFHQGERDAAPFDPGPLLPSALRENLGSDTKLVDPSRKENLIGLYHKTFDVETVLMEHLEGMFEPGSTERRWTWLDGGGTPEGVWVHDDKMHVGASHHTWPFEGITNLWDLVRVLKFGDQDKVEGDAFEQFDAENRPLQELASQRAMTAWVRELPEIQAATEDRLTGIVNQLERLTTEAAIVSYLYNLRDTMNLTGDEKKAIANRARDRFKKVMHGTTYSPADVRAMLKRPLAEMHPSAPDWAKGFIWINEEECFMHRDTKVTLSEKAFNLANGRHMVEFADEDGKVPPASRMVLDVWRMPVVDRIGFNPAVACEKALTKNADIYMMDGVWYLNRFRMDLLPTKLESFTKADREAIEIIKDHFTLLIPNRRERRLLLDYLGFCVKHPGVKIRWAPIIKGIEGDGKSLIGDIVMGCLGMANTRKLDSGTLEGSDFSGWGSDQAFTVIEELKMHGHNRYDVSNKLKPFITNDIIEVHRKGKDPYNAPNTTNYLLFTNFDDGMPLSQNDRRYFIIWSPFGTVEELKAAILALTGLDSDTYFERAFEAIHNHIDAIYTWLISREFSAEFKPNGRAPITDARNAVVELSTPDEEIAVTNMLEQQALGVYPDLVSPWFLADVLATQNGMRLRTNRLAAQLKKLGFFPSSRKVKAFGKVGLCYYKGRTEPKDFLVAFKEAEDRRQAMLVEDQFND